MQGMFAHGELVGRFCNLCMNRSQLGRGCQSECGATRRDATRRGKGVPFSTINSRSHPHPERAFSSSSYFVGPINNTGLLHSPPDGPRAAQTLDDDRRNEQRRKLGMGDGMARSATNKCGRIAQQMREWLRATYMHVRSIAVSKPF